MKKLQTMLYLITLATVLMLNACGGGSGGGSSGGSGGGSGGGDTNHTNISSNWDEMKWDQGQWK